MSRGAFKPMIDEDADIGPTSPSAIGPARPGDPSDMSVVARIGPPAAPPDWAAIRDRLLRYARALCASGPRAHLDAEDLVQHALAKLLARDPHHVHLGYARAIVTNKWLDSQRSFRARIAALRRIADGYLATDSPSHAASPQARCSDIDRAPGSAGGKFGSSPPAEAALDRAEQSELARCAIDRLAPRQRAVLVMRLIEGLSYEHIAADLSCTVDAVRASLHLARKAVRDALDHRPLRPGGPATEAGEIAPATRPSPSRVRHNRKHGNNPGDDA